MQRTGKLIRFFSRIFLSTAVSLKCLKLKLLMFLLDMMKQTCLSYRVNFSLRRSIFASKYKTLLCHQKKNILLLMQLGVNSRILLKNTGSTIKYFKKVSTLLSISVLGSDQMRATLEELKYRRLDLLAMKTKTFKLEKIQAILEALKTKKEGVFF
jgi:hypothetical protein